MGSPNDGSVIDWVRQQVQAWRGLVQAPFDTMDATTRQQEDDLIELIFGLRQETKSALILPVEVDISLERNPEIWRSFHEQLQDEVNNALTAMVANYLEHRQELTRFGWQVSLRLINPPDGDERVVATLGTVTIWRVGFDQALGYEFDAATADDRRDPRDSQAGGPGPTLPISSLPGQGDHTVPLGALTETGPTVELWIRTSEGRSASSVGSVTSHLGMVIGRDVASALVVPTVFKEVSRRALKAVAVTASAVTFEVANDNGALVRGVNVTHDPGSRVMLESGDVLILPTSRGEVTIVVR